MMTDIVLQILQLRYGIWVKMLAKWKAEGIATGLFGKSWALGDEQIARLSTTALEDISTKDLQLTLGQLRETDRNIKFATLKHQYITGFFVLAVHDRYDNATGDQGFDKTKYKTWGVSCEELIKMNRMTAWRYEKLHLLIKAYPMLIASDETMTDLLAWADAINKEMCAEDGYQKFKKGKKGTVLDKKWTPPYPKLLEETWHTLGLAQLETVTWKDEHSFCSETHEWIEEGISKTDRRLLRLSHGKYQVHIPDKVKGAAEADDESDDDDEEPQDLEGQMASMSKMQAVTYQDVEYFVDEEDVMFNADNLQAVGVWDAENQKMLPLPDGYVQPEFSESEEEIEEESEEEEEDAETEPEDMELVIYQGHKFLVDFGDDRAPMFNFNPPHRLVGYWDAENEEMLPLPDDS